MTRRSHTYFFSIIPLVLLHNPLFNFLFLFFFAIFASFAVNFFLLFFFVWQDHHFTHVFGAVLDQLAAVKEFLQRQAV